MIQFQNVSKIYGKDVPALDGVSFEIEKGSFVYLVGPTGSGKTTIFRLIIHDLKPTDGNIIIGDWNITKLPKSKIPALRRRVGIIFQDLKLLMDRTVVENVMLPLQFTGVNSKEARKRAEEILLEVGLVNKEDKFPIQLSGGEMQRVAIARALIYEPEVLIADEPTGNLDWDTSLQIINLLESINARGTTVFMTTHNDNIIKQTDKRVLHMEHGKLKHDKPGKEKKHKEEPEKKEHEEKPHSAEASRGEKEEKTEEKSEKKE